MTEPGWSFRTVRKYVLLQLPGAALCLLVLYLLRQWLDFPGWVLWGIFSLWVLKDAVMFPLVWRSYAAHSGEEHNPLVGMRGVARERLAPSGYILIRGELWRAEIPAGEPPVEKGTTVRVRRVHGLTLLVDPDPGENGRSSTPSCFCLFF